MHFISISAWVCGGDRVRQCTGIRDQHSKVFRIRVPLHAQSAPSRTKVRIVTYNPDRTNSVSNKIDISFFRNFSEESNSITKSKLNSSEDSYTLTWYTTQLMEEHRYITFNSYNELFTTGIIPLFALCFFNYKVSPMPCFHFNQFLSMKTFLICRFTMRSSPLPISA